MLPQLLQQDGPQRATIVHQTGSHFAIRWGPWKAINGLGSGGFTAPATIEEEPGGPSGQLYHLERDLSETTNLWLEHPEVVEQLLGQLKKYREAG
jgi:hypothetical protein